MIRFIFGFVERRQARRLPNLFRKPLTTFSLRKGDQYLNLGQYGEVEALIYMLLSCQSVGLSSHSDSINFASSRQLHCGKLKTFAPRSSFSHTCGILKLFWFVTDFYSPSNLAGLVCFCTELLWQRLFYRLQAVSHKTNLSGSCISSLTYLRLCSRASVTGDVGEVPIGPRENPGNSIR